MNSTSHRQSFRVPHDHPCLPGHFPGRPLVPGVLLLEQVALALHAWRGERVRRIVEAKFVAPLLPEQSAEVHLTDGAGKVRFEVHREGVLLARGTVEGVT